MSPTMSDLAVATPLVPVGSTGRLGGIGNLVRKELGQWWGTRRWWIHLLIWVVLLNGVTTTVMLTEPGLGADALLREVVQTFLLLGPTAIGIGVVLTVQGAIIGEKELGTAAWVISKPVSRGSFVLAKFVAHSVGFIVTAVIVPAILFTIAAAVLLPQPPSNVLLAAGVGVVMLAVPFYVALTLALGTVFDGRGPVAGIGIVLLLAGLQFKGMLPAAVVNLTPWLLGDTATSITLGDALGPNWFVPIVATTVAAVAFICVAMWRFGREEL